MSHFKDFRPSRSSAEPDLSATVPDILSPALSNREAPSESTEIFLFPSGSINFPGRWERLERDENSVLLKFCDSSAVCYREKDGLTAILEVGGRFPGERASIMLKRHAQAGPRILKDFEISALDASLAVSDPAITQEPLTGSFEELGGRLILVLQRQLNQQRMKEAQIVYPLESGEDFAQFRLRAVKPEFPFYFDLLRSALKTVTW